MEILQDYHILFIAISFMLLIITITFLFVNNTKEKTIAAMIMSGINYIICIFNSFGFFRIGIVGYIGDGTISVNEYIEMYPVFAIFLLLYWVNVVFLFYCYWLWVRNPWRINELGSSEVNSMKDI